MNDKEKTLSLILDSARHEFADKGLYGANMQLIAKNAGVTKQLIHHYFGTKEDLYTKVISDLADKSIAHLLSEDITGLEPTDALRKLLYSIFDFYSSNRCGPLVNQENMYAGANLHLHNKIYNLDSVISVFGNIIGSVA
jgi:AcrR family transcriptional regulator